MVLLKLKESKNDCNALITGKNKSSIKPFGYWKFMVFTDLPTVRMANRILNEYGERIKLLNSKKDLDSKEKIYVCYVSINN